MNFQHSNAMLGQASKGGHLSMRGFSSCYPYEILFGLLSLFQKFSAQFCILGLLDLGKARRARRGARQLPHLRVAAPEVLTCRISVPRGAGYYCSQRHYEFVKALRVWGPSDFQEPTSNELPHLRFLPFLLNSTPPCYQQADSGR